MWSVQDLERCDPPLGGPLSACGVSAAAGTGHDGNFSCPGPYLIDLRLEESRTGGAGGGDSVASRVGAVITGAKFNPD